MGSIWVGGQSAARKPQASSATMDAMQGPPFRRCHRPADTILSHSGAGESWEASEPTFVHGSDPSADGWCSKSHVTEVDQCGHGPDCEAGFILFVKVTFEDSFSFDGHSALGGFKHCDFGSVE